MATAEHPMWVIKRYPALGNKVGFVMVPDAQRAALIADGGAMDTFDYRAQISPAPPITDIAFAQSPLTTAATVGTVAGTLTVDGGTPPFTFALTDPDAANFTIAGNEVRTAATLTARTYSMHVTATDSAGRRYIDPLTVTVTVAELQETTARRATRK